MLYYIYLLFNSSILNSSMIFVLSFKDHELRRKIHEKTGL